MGRIMAPHGVRGLVKVASFTADPKALGAYGPLQDEAGRAIRVAIKGTLKGLVLAAVDGVTTREAAEALTGRDLYAPRAALPDPGEDIYVADLVGLAVRRLDGAVLGRVVAVQEFGAGPLLEVAPEEGEETVFIPFTREAVPVVAPDKGHVIVDLPLGLWPGDTDEEDGGTP